MCGIAGFVGHGSEADLRAMIRRLVHRGPDAEGLWWDKAKGVFLGHRRLAVIDLAGGDQPMWTADRDLGVVFNGEIYNHRELRKQLESVGHRFRTDHSDTEVLLHGYREWGENLPQRLNGMWAFALYDRRNGLLFLSRDRFGKKPLYYTLQNGTFAFASELTALMSHGNLERQVSRISLKKYFAYGYIPAPNVLYRQVHKLPGGFNLRLNIPTMEFTTRRYWEFVLEPFSHPDHGQIKTWEEQLRELIKKAVRRRLESDVPLGVFLSGGIDSSAVAAYAVNEKGKNGVKTFSIGFRERTFDESNFANQVAQFLGTKHHLETFFAESASDYAKEIVDRLDEPMGDSSLLATSLLCGVTRQHITVALSGDGADELFAGYDPFRALKLAEWYNRIIPRPVHAAIRLLAARLPTSYQNLSMEFKIKRALLGLSHPKKLWNAVWMGPLDPAELEDLFEEPMDIEEVYSEAIEQWDHCRQESLVERTLQFFTRLFLQNSVLAKVDRASMMHSLEVRSPFLDIELVDFARRIPADWKFRHGQTKYILKQALAPVLPKRILHRRKKGFGVPIGRWFKENDLHFSGNALTASVWPGFSKKRINEHMSGSHDHRLFLWSQWVLGRYLTRHDVGFP